MAWRQTGTNIPCVNGNTVDFIKTNPFENVLKMTPILFSPNVLKNVIHIGENTRWQITLDINPGHSGDILMHGALWLLW